MNLSLVSIIVAAALPSPRAQMPDSARVPIVQTSGTAKRSVAPDLATINIQYSAVGRSVPEAGSHLAMKTDSLRRALASLGIPRDSTPNRGRWYWWGGRVQQVIGPSLCTDRPHPPTQAGTCDWHNDTSYRASDGLEIRVHDLTRLGAVMDTLLGRGITDISPIQFVAGDGSAARLDALREATLAARAQAEAVASAGGLALGRVISFSTQAPDYSWPEAFVTTGAIATPRDAGTVIVRPSVTVDVTVYAKWELVSKTQ